MMLPSLNRCYSEGEPPQIMRELPPSATPRSAAPRQLEIQLPPAVEVAILHDEIGLTEVGLGDWGRPAIAPFFLTLLLAALHWWIGRPRRKRSACSSE